MRKNRDNKDLQRLFEVKASKLEQKEDIEEVDKAISTKLIELQKDDVEKELEQLMTTKKNKGRCAAVFKTFQKICGNKKANQEQVSMIDPVSKVAIFDPSELKSVSLKYCVDLLTQHTANDDLEKDFFIQDIIHLVRNENGLDEEFGMKDFEDRMKVLETKCANKYKFIVNSGEGYRNCLFSMFANIWQTEDKPQQWRNTVIVQLYKGKGSKSDFNCQRNLHMKEAEPKLFEGIVVDKSKDRLVRACSKFQIGGIPGHRPQEHLFSVKSIIGLYKYLNIPLFVSYWDISKYFDKEILRDAMDTLYQAGIQGKLYRLWYMLNKDTQIRVKTSFGMTDVAATGENVAQGSIGGGLISSLNLDKTVTSYFAGAEEASYMNMKLSPILFQDDSIRFSTSIEEVQKGNILMSNAMRIKQLDLNVDKCGVIIFGSKKKVDEIKSEVENKKYFSMNGSEIKIKIEDKYLGDYLHMGGLSKCVEATVAKRYGACLHKILELKSVIEDFRMHSLGGIKVGMEIFKLAILPQLLYNSDTWVEMTEQTVNRIESLQRILLRCLLCVPNSTPVAALSWDSGLISLRYQIYQNKLMFIHHLMSLDPSSLASEIFTLQKNFNLPGLVKEGRQLFEQFSLPNIIDEERKISKLQWKRLVKKTMYESFGNYLANEIKSSSKLKDGPMVGESFGQKNYLSEMSMHDARTLFRIRSKTNNIRMNQQNNKENARNLWKCRECGNIDTQSHILWCPYFANLREGKSINDDADLVSYFTEVFKIREDINNQECE